MNHRLDHAARRIAVGVALLVCAGCAHAPVAASKPLTFEEAFARGLEAAAQRQWEPAVQYFTEADERVRATNEVHPGLLFNLGLAHAQAGNDATAIAWFEAYLAAVSDAPNAAAIRAERQRLEAALEAKVKLLFEAAVTAAAATPVASGVRSGVSTDLAKAGYLDWAVEVYRPQVDATGSELEEYLAKTRSAMVRQSAKILIDLGDVAAAVALAPQMTTSDDRDGFWMDLGYYYLYAATPLDVARSLEALGRIEDADYRETHLNGTAERRQALQDTPPRTTAEPTAVEVWSHLARANGGSPETLPQRVQELATNATRTASWDVISRLTTIARDLRIQLFQIHAIEQHLARHAAHALSN